MPASARRSADLIARYCAPRSGGWTNPAPLAGRRSSTAGTKASGTKPARAVRLARLPAMRPAQVSIPKATQTNPAQGATQVKSDSHSRLGAGAWNWRLTRSSGQGTALSRMVVLIGLPRITPGNPMLRISLPTVQRATSIASRCICRQTLRTPDRPESSHRKCAEYLAAAWHRAVPERPALPDRPAWPGDQSRGGDRHDCADRLDPMAALMIAGEGNHRLSGRPGSASAKWALALRRTAFVGVKVPRTFT